MSTCDQFSRRYAVQCARLLLVASNAGYECVGYDAWRTGCIDQPEWVDQITFLGSRQ